MRLNIYPKIYFLAEKKVKYLSLNPGAIPEKMDFKY
jgi:hypothetical protein